jgi:hypothetical protein
MVIVRAGMLAFVFFNLMPVGGAFALCGDVSGDGQRTAADALTVLKTAVGQDVALDCSCGECGTSVVSPAARAHCADVNGDGQRTAADALTVLKTAVGQNVPLGCSCAACEDSEECPPEDALDDRTYKETYTCDISFDGGPRSCDSDEASDSIRFFHEADGNYEVRDVEDTGFVYNGTLTCRTFEWEALSPGNYTEAGTWTFSKNLTSFSGSSTYTAIDGSYTGDCNTTGAQSGDPPIPPRPPGCE